MNDILNRIDQRLDEVKKSRRAASLEAGLGAEYIRDMERKKTRSPSISVLEKLAPVLKTSVEWLRTGGEIQASANSAARHETVPLVGIVAAGATMTLLEYGQWDPAERVPAPEGATEKTVAAEVRGVSMGELFDRWLVYYDEIRDPPGRELLNKLCVLGLADGRIVVKKLRPGSRDGLWTLLSNNEEPMKDQVVVWAARVKQMSPR